MKKLAFDLIYKVYGDSDSIVFINYGKEVRVHLQDIKNISYQVATNPPGTTMSIRHNTRARKELSFVPQNNFTPLQIHNILKN